MTDKNDSLIVTVKLTKIFRDFWLREKVTAVADLDLNVHRGEVFGLLGPNGSGKSTTIKMILGLLFPTRGRISVLGHQPTDVKVKSRIGFMPEESYLYPFLSAYETLDFYGRLFHQNRSQRHKRTEMLLDMVGLTAVAHRRVGEYSKGMQRRIGLAQALINDPDLLILDEPTAGMDPIGARQFKDLISTLAQRGKTVLLSSHLLADVEDVCDRVCILYGGRQRALGPIDDLLALQSRTQITTEALDDQTLAKLEQVLASEGKDILSVEAPREKLESLFIRIVSQAHEQKLKTGGAGPAGQVAEFLRSESQKGTDLIEKLVAAGQPTDQDEQQVVSQAQKAPIGPAREVIGELLSGVQNPQSDVQVEGEATSQTAPPSKPAEDQAVLDDLLGTDKPAGGQEA